MVLSWWKVLYIITMLLLIWKCYVGIFKLLKKAIMVFNDSFTHSMTNGLPKSCKHNLKASMGIGYEEENDRAALMCVNL